MKHSFTKVRGYHSYGGCWLDWNVTLSHTLHEGNLMGGKSNSRIPFLLADAMG